tara:strand:+ start:17 stop:505 length:489 start_codon:yes stop_codon:yes gene_type:complete
MGFSTNVIAPASYTEVDSSAKFSLGCLSFCDDGKAYRYVQFADSVAVTAGMVLCYEAAQANGYVVTPDRSSDENSVMAAGVAPAAVALNTTTPQYGWIQVSGYCAVVKGNDDDIAAGTWIMPHASADGCAETLATDNGEAAFGICLTAESGNVFDALLKGLI